MRYLIQCYNKRQELVVNVKTNDWDAATRLFAVLQLDDSNNLDYGELLDCEGPFYDSFNRS